MSNYRVHAKSDKFQLCIGATSAKNGAWDAVKYVLDRAEEMCKKGELEDKDDVNEILANMTSITVEKIDSVEDV
jgi:hypothetical protein